MGKVSVSWGSSHGSLEQLTFSLLDFDENYMTIKKKINAKRLDTLTMERRKKVCFKGYDEENIVHLFPKYDIWRQSNSN